MKHVLLLLCGLMLSACIEVDDFGKYWNQAFRDACIEAIARDRYYDDPKPHSMKNLAHNLKVGDHTFLMLKEERARRGGNMIRYKVENGEYIAYHLNEDKREDFERDFPDHRLRITGETVTIPRLNRHSLTILEAVANDESYWQEAERLPYNPTHNPKCKQ